MDSNVSKNTNSHNFFKLEVKRKKLGISTKNLLKQELLLILNSYQQKFDVQIEQNYFASILENKISISNYKNQPAKHFRSITSLTETKSVPIVYSCPIGLLLAANQSHALQIIMQQIKQLVSNRENADLELLSVLVEIEIVDRGWINFYLGSKFMAIWLEQSLVWHQRAIINDRAFAKKEICAWENTFTNLFPVQYIHARCCSLLNLAARENLISLSDDSPWIVRPIPTKIFPWLDEQNTLWLTRLAERNLLQQLLIVADSWVEDISDREACTESNRQWSKLAFNLSQATAIFLADCRFLGEVKQKYPPLAIARLGLIALVQLWLQRILGEKFGVAASKSM